MLRRLTRLLTVAFWMLALAVSVSMLPAAAAPPVEERGQPSRRPEATYRTVRVGDTLYSIAWEVGQDYHDLGAWNGLHPPFVIHPGQRLRLLPPAGKSGAPPRQHKVHAGDTLYRIAVTNGLSVSDLAAWNGLKEPYILRPGRVLYLTPPAVDVPRSTTPSPPFTKTPIWVWPTDGTPRTRFMASGASKGIDISGRMGQMIRAASSGKVVYAGSGLRGYGRLIIVQHDAELLSAYAHCAALHVKEGDVIYTGQKIAEMGNSGTDRVQLHFEIRHRGVPVDPFDYLPKKPNVAPQALGTKKSQ